MPLYLIRLFYLHNRRTNAFRNIKKIIKYKQWNPSSTNIIGINEINLSDFFLPIFSSNLWTYFDPKPETYEKLI